MKAYRFIAAKSTGPFSLATVETELELIERQDRDELERCRAALQQIAARDGGDPIELAAKILRAPRWNERDRLRRAIPNIALTMGDVPAGGVALREYRDRKRP